VEVFKLEGEVLRLAMVRRYSLGKYPRDCRLFDMEINGSVMRIWADIGHGQSKGIQFELEGYDAGDFDVLFGNLRRILRKGPKLQRTGVELDLDHI
jgi:hypothetical protein